MLKVLLLVSLTLAPLFSGVAGDLAGRWLQPVVTNIYPGVWRVRLGNPEGFTPETTRVAAPRSEGFKNLPPASSPPFRLEELGCRLNGSRAAVHILFEGNGQQLYGFGLDPGAYQQLGLTKNLTVCASVMGKTGASHGPVPFYLSTSGYGVYVDTARVPIVHVASLNPNSAAKKSTAQTASTPATSEAELYRARSGSGGEVVFELPGNSSGVDVYVFGGPTMREVVQRYNLFSGGGAVPPYWGLGLKYRTFTRANQQNVLKSARAIRALKIPCDMLGLEPGWQSRSYSCSFTWAKDRFTPLTATDSMAGKKSATRKLRSRDMAHTSESTKQTGTNSSNGLHAGNC